MSSSSNANYYGDFRSESKCGCSRSNIKVIKQTWDSCRITNYAAHVIGNIFSKLFFSNLTHDFILLRYKCTNCFKYGNITIDYSDKGVRLRYGKFYNTTVLSNTYEKSSNISLSTISAEAESIRTSGF